MFHHVVLAGFHEPLADADAAFFSEQFAVIAREVPGVVSLQFVSNESQRSPHYTHAFVATFVDADAHGLYQRAASHDAMRSRFLALKSAMEVLDYQV